jgi:hypothetical protein
MNEFKDPFELVQQFEKKAREDGAKKFYEQICIRLASMHKDTELTVSMFQEIIDREATKWISNSGQSAGKMADQS